MLLAVSIDFWEHTQWDDALIGLSVLLSAVAVIWQKLIRPMKGAVERMATAWDWVVKEMTPNGGESLRDKVNQAAAASQKVVDMIPALVARIERLEEIVLQQNKERSS